jgi:predicted dehydrogenase
MAKQVRLGIVGLGAQGSTYAQLITGGRVPNMEIGAICETNPVIAAAIRSTYPGEFDSVGGSQHADVLQNFAANILEGPP